jgi:hypothetical protein
VFDLTNNLLNRVFFSALRLRCGVFILKVFHLRAGQAKGKTKKATATGGLFVLGS